MKRDNELPIIRAFYDFLLWLNPKISKFPRDHRFTLGERLELQAYEILENLIRAKYRKDRKAILDDVNLGLEIVRFQIQVAKDLRCLPKPWGGVFSCADRMTTIGVTLYLY